MIKTICYGKVDYFNTAKEAIRYFEEGMCFCDPGSSEYERYATIVGKLEAGKTTASDDYWSED
jgi:hypothetical protein